MAKRRDRRGQNDSAKDQKKTMAKRKPAAVEPADAAPSRGIAGSNQAGFAVVGIGASAGGLDAFKRFLTVMPADANMAFVLVQHLDPTHESLTAELLARHTEMPVVQVVDEMQVEPNHIYVIPPNAYLTISGRTLHLTAPAERHGIRMAIDFFFRSLADDQQERAIGIILTGSGTDGTLGAREIKAGGGMVIVQSPETAQFDSMPRSVIATGMVDYVLPIEQMAEALIGYVRHWYVNGASGPPPLTVKATDHLTTILALLRAHVKYDFSCYKRGTLTRRVERRMGLNHLEQMTDYVEFLRQNPDEVQALYKDLLIGVTNFFRELEAWDSLEKLVLAPLVAKAGQAGGTPSAERGALRVWVPGCATGEEAYSIAILLTERLRAADQTRELQIFASDIDPEALAFARAGVYPENIVADVRPERLRLFFIKGEHTFRINREIRDAVVFAEQNLISDPPFSKLDLVSCRNLLIYLEPESQQRILSLFHFALRPDGYLFLGSSETISQQHDLFEPVSRKWRIYRRLAPPRHDRVELPAQGSVRPGTRAAVELAEPRVCHLATLAQHFMLQRYAPACVLINRKAEVLYLNGPVDQYLQLPNGVLHAHLIAMAREGLRTRLRAAVQQAIRDEGLVEVSGIRVQRGRDFRVVRLTVEPLRHPKEAEGLLLVTFDEQHEQRPTRATGAEPPEPLRPEGVEAGIDYEAIIRQLDDELRSTREDLQSTIEELETSNEEVKAANEEVMSINEELQSANEELETSKEELQSLNEKLQTVNNQLEQKVSEAETANNDLLNLLNSIDVATIFLDRQFRLRRFTPATTRLLRVIGTDVGRPIRDLARSFTGEDLLGDAEHVLQELRAIDKEVPGREGRWYVRRIVPYRTEDDRIDGVVITFTDITKRRADDHALKTLAGQLEQRVAQTETTNAALRESEAKFRNLLEWTPDAVVVADDQGQIIQVNQRLEEMFGYGREELIGQPVERLIPSEVGEQHVEHRARFFAAPHAQTAGMERQVTGTRKNGSEFPAEIHLCSLEIQGRRLAMASVRDVTERKKAEEARARLAAIMQNTSTAIVVLASDGTILNWNHGAERLFGYAEQEAAGQNIKLLLPPERAGEFQQVAAQLRRGGPVEDFETVHRHKDGTSIDVALTVSLVEGEGSCWIARDMRERKRLEQQLAELADDERQRLGRELHDTLGQQFTAIAMMASALRLQLAAASPQHEVLAKLQANIEEAKRQLRSVSKGLLPVEVDAHGLTVALEELAEQVRQIHGVECRFESPEPVPLHDNFTATQLYLIAREAVHNALKHARAGSITIRLRDHEGISLAIHDDGVGIHGQAEGETGMGIRIMRHRCGLVGGTFQVLSPAEGGTAVTCALPAGVDDESCE